MLDQLLGRASLKEHIADLEEEKRHLERELEAESDRRADAVSEKQDAEERVNRLEDRLAELEDRLDRVGSDGDPREFHHEESLTGARRSDVLDTLGSFETGPEGVLTAYVADEHDVPDAVRDRLGDRTALVRRAAPCLIVADDADLIGATLSVPVAPQPFVQWDDHVRIDRPWFEPVGEHALALVRSDLFALGEYDGGKRTAFHGFDADLKSQHSKGGFSQSRFERIRDAQIDTHVERCREALDERSTDTLYVVGERNLLPEFAGAADATRPVGATGEPEPALEDAVREFWTVRLRTL